MTTRDDLTPLDRRPEDVDTSFFRLVPRQPANLSAFFNQALRRAAGRGLAPTAPVPVPPTLPVPTASRLDDAVARIEAGDVRAGIALALAADEPDAESVHVAYNTLRNQVQVDGYKTIASILSLSLVDCLAWLAVQLGTPLVWSHRSFPNAVRDLLHRAGFPDVAITSIEDPYDDTPRPQTNRGSLAALRSEPIDR